MNSSKMPAGGISKKWLEWLEWLGAEREPNLNYLREKWLVCHFKVVRVVRKHNKVVRKWLGEFEANFNISIIEWLGSGYAQLENKLLIPNHSNRQKYNPSGLLQGETCQ